MDVGGGNGDTVSMTQKIAIPVFGNRVSSRLDCSESILLVSIEEGKVVRREETRWTHVNPLEKVRLLIHEGVNVLICGGLTETCANMLHDTDIEVIPWVRGELEQVLVQFTEGSLRPTTSEQNNRISP
jgi:predicted Fe-Mo cluster-binding NifX family protein